MSTTSIAAASGPYKLGGDLEVNRLGYGAMQLTGEGVWGEPDDHDEAIAVLKRAVEAGVNFRLASLPSCRRRGRSVISGSPRSMSISSKRRRRRRRSPASRISST
jgi:hypothetical protein